MELTLDEVLTRLGIECAIRWKLEQRVEYWKEERARARLEADNLREAMGKAEQDTPMDWFNLTPEDFDAVAGSYVRGEDDKGLATLCMEVRGEKEANELRELLWSFRNRMHRPPKSLTDG